MNEQPTRARAWTRIVASAAALAVTVGAVTLLVLTLPAPQAGAAAPTPSAAPASGAQTSIERGRYLVAVTGCNDCHTAGYAQQGGSTPPADWLTGNPVGFKGPWGTSYAANLRLSVQNLTADQWLVFARAERLPPMPWFSLRHMSDADLISMYDFIRALGPKGTLAPATVAPGATTATPFILFVPQTENAPGTNVHH